MKDHSKQHISKGLKLAWSYVRRYWWMYILGIISVLAVDAFNTYLPRLTGEVTDGLATRSITTADIRHYAILILLLAAGITIGRFGWRFFLFGASRSIERDIRNDMFGHLELLSMRYFNEHKTGDLMAHFTNDLQAVRGMLGMTIITAVDGSVMLLMVLYNMVRYVSWSLTGVAVIPLVLIIIGDVIYGKEMHRRFLQKQEAFSDLSDMVQESVSGIRVIKSFVQERKELYAFGKANLFNKEKNMRVVRLQALVMPLLDLIIGLSSLLTLLYGGWLAIKGDITIGSFVAFNTYINMLIWPMIAVGECISSMSQGLASLNRIGVILSEEPDIKDGTDRSVTKLSGTIDLSHLSFAYPGAEDRPALSDINVHVNAGETLAVIGRTGAGKTTLVNLIERLYDTEKADMIRIDGHPLRDIPLAVLRRDMAYVPQDNFLFSDTVENNIAFGKENASHDEVVNAAKAACIHDNIMEFPLQYETLVGERGVTISGGQKQRTSIARALLKQAPVLILDDSLSAVDTNTEEEILTNLKTRRAGKTNIIIAHRISTIQHADHILVLEEGAMAQFGTHEQLLAEEGLYRSLYEKQQLEKQLSEESEGKEVLS